MSVEMKKLLCGQTVPGTDSGPNVKFSRLHGKHASAENDTVRQLAKSPASQDANEHVVEQSFAQQADCRQKLVVSLLANRDAEDTQDADLEAFPRMSGKLTTNETQNPNLHCTRALKPLFLRQQDVTEKVVAESLERIVTATSATAVMAENVADAAKVQGAEFQCFIKQTQEKLTEQAKEIRDLKQCTEKAFGQHSKTMEQAFAQQARNIEKKFTVRWSTLHEDRDDLNRNEMQRSIGKFDKQKKYMFREGKEYASKIATTEFPEGLEKMTNEFLNFERRLEGGQLQDSELQQLRKDLDSLKKKMQVQYEKVMMTVERRFVELTHKFQEILQQFFEKQEEGLRQHQQVITEEVHSIKEDVQQIKEAQQKMQQEYVEQTVYLKEITYLLRSQKGTN